MNWVDYREKLGVCWDDKRKTAALQHKIAISVDEVCHQLAFRHSGNGYEQALTHYFFTVAENPTYKTGDYVRESIIKHKSVVEIISKYIAFTNSIRRYISDLSAALAEKLLFTSLKDLKIPYECIEDDDGIFIFPKGAPELDEALVSAPLEWLKDYPKSHTAWVKALKDYTDQTDENASDIADKFRKALEQFMQEFFASGKTLENLLADYGEYLKKQGVPAEISNDFKKLLKCYTDYMNSYAKHHDGTSRKVLEYIMYETGNVMRLLITLKQEEASDVN